MPGLYARIRIPVITGPALLVPQEAVGHDLRGAYLLVVNGENKVERRNVTSRYPGGPVPGLSGQVWVKMSGWSVKGIQKAVPGRSVNPEKIKPRWNGPLSAPARRSIREVPSRDLEILH